MQVAKLFGDVKSGKGFDLSDNLKLVSEKFGFIAGKSTHQDRLATIKKVYDDTQRLIDPHTADGVKVAIELQKADEMILVAETALPAKFQETIVEAVGEMTLPRPEHTQGLEDKPQYVTVVPNDAQAVAALIEQYITAC